MTDASRGPLPLLLACREAVRCALTAPLEAAGFRVSEAADGAEAVSLVLDGQPALVVFDLEARGLDVLEVVTALRQIRSGATVPILVLAGEDDVGGVTRALACGASDFASWPGNPALLASRARKLVDAERTLSDLRRREALRSVAHRVSRTGSWELDLRTRRLHFSEEAHAILGTSPSDFPPGLEPLLSLCHPDDRPTLRQLLEDALTSGTGFTAEHRLVGPQGVKVVRHEAEAVRGEEAGPAFVLAGATQDVTQHRAAQAEAHFLEFFDRLTRLPNRLLFRDWLERAVATAPLSGGTVALFILDLDDLKRINDSLGYGTGDTLLRRVAERLTTALGHVNPERRDDCLAQRVVVSRPGGDEFIVGVAGMTKAEALRLAGSLLEGLSAPIELEGHDVVVTGCVGLSVYPAGGHDASTLMRSADTALQKAKRLGWGSYEAHDRSPRSLTRPMALRRLDLEIGLRRAFEKDELLLHFQPQVDVKARRLVGIEALVRWRHGTRGLLGPEEFLPIAEETDLIVPLGDWVLRKACAQAAAWEREGLSVSSVAVNVSALQLRRAGLVDVIRTVLHETRLPPARLELEITETTLMEDVEEAGRILNDLTAMGVRVAIDDFGTGYSSLGYLSKLPIGTLKIDRSFVRNADRNQENAAITGTIVAMAQRLGLLAVAEGVETVAEYRALRDQGCRVMQGYLISPPLDVQALGPVLRQMAGGVEEPGTAPGILGLSREPAPRPAADSGSR